MSSACFSATIARDEAVLRFPYDEGLRQLLTRDPRPALGPRASARGASRSAPTRLRRSRSCSRPCEHAPEVSDELERTISRRRSRRRRDECVVELARPDEDWWLSFATDGPADSVAESARAPAGTRAAGDRTRAGAAGRPFGGAAGRGRRGEWLLAAERGGAARARCTPRAPHAGLRGRWRRAGRARRASGLRRRAPPRPPRRALDPDRTRARPSRARARRAAQGCARSTVRPGRSGLAAIEHDAERLAELLEHVEDVSVDPRVTAWLTRATTWRGNVGVEGPPTRPPRAARRSSYCSVTSGGCRERCARSRLTLPAARRCR